MMWAIPLVCALVHAVTVPWAPSYADNGRGHVWTPDGRYENAKNRLTAKLGSDGPATFDAGNYCILEGKLTRIPKKPAWRFQGTSADGVGCPDTPGPASNMVLTILDGPGVNAYGNASRIRVKHARQKRRVSFGGVYEYTGE